MKRKISLSRNNTKNQKKLYLILIGLAIIGFIIGCLFIFILSKDNNSFIKDNLTNYFNNIKPSFNLLFKTIFNYFIYIITIWILGISIIGIPIVIFMYLFKCFILGFSLSSIINSFGFKGILIALFDLFPHKISFIIVLLLVTFYSVSFSIKLIKHLFFKRPINFRESMNKYFKILIISLSISLVISIYEVFISPYLINIFEK